MAKAITKGQLGDCLGRISDYFLQMNENFSGATSSAAGDKGMVPAPAAGDNTKYLCGDGTWKTPSAGGSAFVVSSQTQTGNVIWIEPVN